MRDVNPRFYTKDGTIFHERLHQQQMDREIENVEPYIERNIGKISAKTPQQAMRQATWALEDYRKQINTNMQAPAAHKSIYLQEWHFYHRQYEQYLKSRGAGK